MTRAVAIAAIGFAVGCGDDARVRRPTPPAPDPDPVDIRDPVACAPCHADIAAEWTESQHARSHHSRDPIYAGVRAIRIRNEGVGIATACAGCHTPEFETDPDAPGAVVGVSCATCHHDRVGAEPDQLIGPRDVAARTTPAHGTGPGNRALADGSSICLTCHASLDTPSGLSMCATGAEHAAVAGDGQHSCASCHMPRIAGAATLGSPAPDHASHAFLGPHRAWYQDDPAFAASAIAVTATLSQRSLTVIVANKSGHAFPTGFPGRMAIVQCVGRDAAGKDVWQCAPRVLGKVYVDADGNPTLAPYAAKLASDTRIAAGGADAFTVATSAEVAEVEVAVSMRLVPAPLAAKLNLVDAVEGEARRILTTIATR